MSVGMLLLSKIIEERRAPSTLADNSIDPSMLMNDELVVYEYIRSHFNRYGAVPDRDTINVEINILLPDASHEPFGYWADAVVDRRLSTLLVEGARNITSLVRNGELPTAVQDARTLAASLNDVKSTDQMLDLRDLTSRVVSLHDARQRTAGFGGIPFGFPYLDFISDGAQPGDTVAVVGRPGVGKSYVMLKMALSCYLDGKVPMFLTMEMPPVQCARRLAGLITRAPVDLIRLGRLSYWGRRRLNINLADLWEHAEQPFHIIQGSLSSTVEDLAVRIQETRPDAIYIDGAYLLRSANKHGNKWETVTDTAEYIKRIAAEYEVPLISSYQFNRKGAGNISNIGLSDAIGQLASIVIGLDNEDTDGEFQAWAPVSHKLLQLLKGREGESGVMRLLFDMSKMLVQQDGVVSGSETYTDEGIDE